MKILIIDNYDSFTYNLFHYVEGLNVEVEVFRNDQFNLENLKFYDKVILSPGPGLPKDAGILMDVIRMVPENIPVLGVCLGMQAMAEVYGGSLFNMERVRHGIAIECNVVKEHWLFDGLPLSFEVGLYHSWAVSTPLPDKWNSLLVSKEEVVMAMSHESRPLIGVQFHPESVLTPHGKQIIKNFVLQ